MNSLPIFSILDKIKKGLENNATLILQAPPGAGKSTVVPISLLDESWLGDKIIIMLEPRRVAVRMIATQMAKFLGEEVGMRVGYQVKMESQISAQTKILVVTEAILVRKLQSNQSLNNVALIIFDECHERSIHTDVSLALCLQVQEFIRDDLKILLMSATLNTEALALLLGDVPVISSQGKAYYVEEKYLEITTQEPNVKTLNTLLLSTIVKALDNNVGDILVFLAGMREIQSLQKILEEKLKGNDILILPLFSGLTKQEQEQALIKAAKQKIILATNIAQTSLTIEGVSVVIDTGWHKLSRYNYKTGMNHLELTFISQDFAVQRAGRAGRLSDGICYKLWHKNKILQETTKPEILRTDLCSVILDLALWGVEDFSELKWLDIPSEHVIRKTKEMLQNLMMLDSSFKITQFGKSALSLGLHPRFSYMILKANDLGYAYEACLLAALLSQKDIFKSTYRDSDIVPRLTHLLERDFVSSYINKQSAHEALKEAEVFYKKLKSVVPIHRSLKAFDPQSLGVLFLFAYPDRLAKQRGKGDARYKLSNGKGALLHQEDTLFNEVFLVTPNLNAHDKDSYINLACSISLDTIYEFFSSHVRKSESINYNKQNKKFDIRENYCFLSLQLSSQPLLDTAKIDFTKLILDLLRDEGLELLTWSEKAKNLRARINIIHANIKTDLPDFSDSNLLETLDIWLAPCLSDVHTIKELENLDTYAMLLSLLSWGKRQLVDILAPTSIKVPSGSHIHVDYSNLETPILAVRIQEIFGLSETPKIIENTVPLQIHLLSPALRPIQITYDLKSFWENSYEEVRKELRGQYKRHYWPQNPYEAIATSKTKKRMNLENRTLK